MANSFDADPYITRKGAEVLAAIAQKADSLVQDLAGFESTLTGWAGVDDDYARQVGPQIRKTFKQTLGSGRQVIDAIVSVVDNTAGSAQHVDRAQGDAYDGIVAEQANGRR